MSACEFIGTSRGELSEGWLWYFFYIYHIIWFWIVNIMFSFIYIQLELWNFYCLPQHYFTSYVKKPQYPQRRPIYGVLFMLSIGAYLLSLGWHNFSQCVCPSLQFGVLFWPSNVDKVLAAVSRHWVTRAAYRACIGLYFTCSACSCVLAWIVHCKDYYY